MSVHLLCEERLVQGRSVARETDAEQQSCKHNDILIFAWVQATDVVVICLMEEKLIGFCVCYLEER